MAQKTILIIEDDPRILRFIQSVIKLSGYKVESAMNGKDGLELVRTQEPHLIILDIGLPVMDGWEVLKEVRTFSGIPVIILSARGEDIDKVKGLKLGADDYLAKPFNPDELLARIEAVMRRSKVITSEETGVFSFDEITVDLKKHIIEANGKQTGLTRLDGLLLGYLIKNSGRVLTYENILSNVWGTEYRDDIQLLRTAVNRIRGKFGKVPFAKGLIKNIPRVGYLFDIPVKTK